MPRTAEIKAAFTKPDIRVNVNAWVAAMHNTVVLEFTTTKACGIKLHLWTPEGNTGIVTQGATGDVSWVTRSFENTPLLEWPCHVALAMKALPQATTLQPGRTTTVTVTLYTNHDKKQWKEAAIRDAAAITNTSISAMRKAHRQWWNDLWQRSSIQIGDTLLEKY